MKRGLAFLLSCLLVLTSAAPALADTDQTAAESSAAFPVSYDSRAEVTFRVPVDVRPQDWAKLAAGIDPESGYTGDSVTLSGTASDQILSLTAAQKVFVLSRSIDIVEAVWFGMNDEPNFLGSPDERIKRALMDDCQVLLGDDYEILGWDDEAVVVYNTDEAKEEAEVISDEVTENSQPGQAEEDSAVEEISEEEPASEEAVLDNESVEEDVIMDEEPAAEEAVLDEVPSAEENVCEEETEVLTGTAAEELPAADMSDAEVAAQEMAEAVEITEPAAEEPRETASETVIGAWLAKNLSTGAIGTLAYDDASTASCEVLCLKTANQEEIRYSYRSDGGIGDGRIKAVHEEDPVEIKNGPWIAEVFTALHDENLKEISFYTDANETTYDLIIYIKKGGNKAFSDDEDLSADPIEGFFERPAELGTGFSETLTGTVTGAGLHTVALPERVLLTEGTAFAVALRFRDDRAALFYDSTETAYDESGRELWTSVSASEPGTQFTSVSTLDWQELEPAGERAWRLGAVTDYDPSAPVMQETNAPITDGDVYIIRSALDRNYVLDVKGGEVAIRTNIQIHTANSTVAQKWFAVENTDGTWSFVSYMAGRALDVEGNNGSIRTNVQLHTPRFRDSQRWKIVDAGDGTYYIRHADSGLNLDVSGGNAKNGANIQIFKAMESAGQKFIFEKVSEKDFSGEYVLTMVSSAQTAIGVANASKDEEANIEAQTRTMAAQQCFTLTRVSGSYYKIINKNSGKVLTINSRAAAGMNVKQASYSGTDLQLWRVVKNDDNTYTFFSKALNNICLDVAGGKTDPGTNVRANGYVKGNHQRFKLRDPNKGELDGTYVIRSALYPDRVLDVAGGSTDAGANIQSYNNNWSQAQQFVFKKANVTSADPIYYITNKSSGKMLAYSGTLANDANVVQDTAAQNEARQWKVTANSDGTYTISPAQNTSLALDIASASIAYKANIRVHKANSSIAQKWYLSSQRINSCVLASANKVQVTGAATEEAGDDNKIYLFGLNPTNYALGSATPIASCTAGESFTITSSALDMEQYITREFFTGIKLNGKYHLTSNGMYITNPEKASTKSTARTNPINKKGMALSSYSDSFINDAINTLHIKHTAMNVPLAAFVTSQNVSFSYQGQTYRYINMEGYKTIVRRLNAAGVQVTGVIYADKSLITGGYSDYVTPTGRSAPATATLVGMNASEATGRAKLEAAFAYLASEFSSPDCHIDNWVIGNELDNPVTWNYCGDSLPLDQYVTLYSQVYRLAFNAMKRVWGNVRVYDSLDNVWNANRGSQYYTARAFQDSLNSVLSGEGAIDWGMAFHPYCAPELDPRIWAHPEYATSDAKTSPRITLDNIKILPAYVSSAYGSGHPIILSETGVNYSCKGTPYPNEQAAAIAYGYYNVESSSGIDNMIIHNEIAGEWSLGLFNDANFTSRRPSYEVFAYMDGKNSAANYTTVKKYGTKTLLQIVGEGKGVSNISRWTEVVPGLNMSTFLDSRY